MRNKHTKQQLQEQLLAEFDAVNKFGRGVGTNCSVLEPKH